MAHSSDVVGPADEANIHAETVADVDALYAGVQRLPFGCVKFAIARTRRARLAAPYIPRRLHLASHNLLKRGEIAQVNPNHIGFHFTYVAFLHRQSRSES